MANVHGLYSNRDDDDDDDASDKDEPSNARYVGGVNSRGGGSGLAVEPNRNDDNEGGSSDARDSIFGAASGLEENEQAPRRTITMWRNGFQVDNGDYRRLDDPANQDFLRALAMGRTPRELLTASEENVVVNLVDHRNKDFVETFRSFSGQGESLGTSQVTSVSTDGIIIPSTLPEEVPALDESRPSTSIQVKLLNGKRKVLKVNLDATVETLASMLDSDQNFRLVTGFPPQPITNLKATIQDAGLKGAQVMMQKA